jgi:hypothetical protein
MSQNPNIPMTDVVCNQEGNRAKKASHVRTMRVKHKMRLNSTTNYTKSILSLSLFCCTSLLDDVVTGLLANSTGSLTVLTSFAFLK